ncbi:hypothetical protein KFL_001300280 [Klebsormidium nitens]|uniref:MYND-type domain-containing protein n=1 Tax=Klebsormidium nitens TaxID=105231 RepID=A0A1Y1HWE4_KLENI|nr:hypothetical protein KFL_001300280 [Klebsormidium nitens]|eukprot:GAQ82964.1 hypothetical protein KFL_001300280 [Klebsormidium nitens]
MRPEGSQVLQRILSNAQSADDTTSFLAVRRLKDIFLTYLASDQFVLESAVHTAAFVLESGIMKPIKQGLEDIAAGQSWTLTSDPKELERNVGSGTSRNVSLVFLKPVTYLQALFGLAIDKRTVNFILKEFPALPLLLRTIFQMETLSKLRKKFPEQRPDLETRDAIVRTLQKLFLQENIALETAQSTGFFTAVLQYALEADSPQCLTDAIRRVVCLIQAVCNDFDGHALKSDLLLFATKVFHNPSEKIEILWTIRILQKCLHDCVRLPGGPSRPFPKSPPLRSSVLALVLCGEFLEPSDHRFLVGFACILKHGSFDVIVDQQETEISARKDPVVVEIAKQLRAILSADTPGDPTLYVFPNKSRYQKAAFEEAMRTGLVARSRKSARRCSGPGCEKEETKPGEFRVCSACKLAVYCGRGFRVRSTPV